MSGRKVLLALLCMFALLCAIALYLRATNEDKTVPGPESNQLLPRVRGLLLTSRNSRDIDCIELPSLKETLIRPMKPEAGDDPTIHALSGPDAEGRIAYIEDHRTDNPNNERHLLKTIRLDGTDNIELFSRPGNALWATSIGKGEIGKALALSPIGGHVAFLTQLKGAQMPGALLSEGLVELWDVEKKTCSKTEVKTIDCGLAWFPVGERMAVVNLVSLH